MKIVIVGGLNTPTTFIANRGTKWCQHWISHATNQHYQIFSSRVRFQWENYWPFIRSWCRLERNKIFTVLVNHFTWYYVVIGLQQKSSKLMLRNRRNSTVDYSQAWNVTTHISLLLQMFSVYCAIDITFHGNIVEKVCCDSSKCFLQLYQINLVSS